jgi:hypothetical protein
MGNQISNLFTNTNEETETTKLKPASVRQIIDYIATYYILTMDFQSLRKLYDIEYCDKLVILTSDIIERYFTDIQITYLAENIKNGKNEARKNEAEKPENLEKDKIIFFDKDELSNLDIKNPSKKRRVCLGIAKFYIKIAHVFATILTTINPVYVYKDEDGNTVKADIYNRNKIPKGTEVEILKLNICDNRIDALQRDANVNFSDDLENDTEIKIHPKMCSFNLKAKKDYDDEDFLKDLDDEPGIPELMELYYDDDYDYETGKFKGMKPETQLIFNENLQSFYSVFAETNGLPMPENIKKFSDIKLKDYNKKTKCRGKNAPYDSSVRGTLEDDLFKQYAENLKQMLKKANSNQELLLDVLNKLFVYMTDPQTKKKIIRINPELSEELLQEVIIETRAIIINLYLTCETDFANGIKIYEAIVDKKIIETAKSQIETMENSREKLVTDEEIPKPAELRELKEIADRKIQKQKEMVAIEEVKIQKEQEKIEIVRPVIQEVEPPVKKIEVEQPIQKVEVEQPQVKVKINVQGLNEAKGLSEATTNDETKSEVENPVPLMQAAGSRKYKRKGKPKSKTRKFKK